MRKTSVFLRITRLFTILFVVIFAGFTSNSYAITLTLVKSGGSGVLTLYPSVASTMSVNSGTDNAIVTCNGNICNFPETTPLSWVGGGDATPVLSTKYGTITNPYGMWCSQPFKRGICNYPPLSNYTVSSDSTYYAAWDCPAGYYGRTDLVCVPAGVGYWSPAEDYIENSFVYRANNRYQCPTGYTTETTTASSIQDCVKITAAESDCGPSAQIVENITAVSNISYTNLDGMTFNYTSSDSITTNKTGRNILPIAGYYYANDINATDICPAVGVGYWSPGTEIMTDWFTFYPYHNYKCPDGYTTDTATSGYFTDCKQTESVSDSDCGINATVTLSIADITAGSYDSCPDNICTFDENIIEYTNEISINNVAAIAGHYYIDAAGVEAVTTNNYTGDICPLTPINSWSPGETTVINGFTHNPNNFYRCPDGFITSSVGSSVLTDCTKVETINDSDCGSDPYLETLISGLSSGPTSCDLNGGCDSGIPITSNYLNMDITPGYYYVGNIYAADVCPEAGTGYWAPGGGPEYEILGSGLRYYGDSRYQCPTGFTTETTTSNFYDDCVVSVQSISDTDCGTGAEKVTYVSDLISPEFTTGSDVNTKDYVDGYAAESVTARGIAATAGHYYSGNPSITDVCPVVGIGYWSPGSSIAIAGTVHMQNNRYQCPTNYTTQFDTSDSLYDCQTTITGWDSDCGDNSEWIQQITSLSSISYSFLSGNTANYSNASGISTDTIGIQNLAPIAGYYYSGNLHPDEPSEYCIQVGVGYFSPEGDQYRYQCPVAGSNYSASYTTDTTTSDSSSDCYLLEDLNSIDSDCLSGIGYRKTSLSDLSSPRTAIDVDGSELYLGYSDYTFFDINYASVCTSSYSFYSQNYTINDVAADNYYYDFGSLTSGANNICAHCADYLAEDFPLSQNGANGNANTCYQEKICLPVSYNEYTADYDSTTTNWYYGSTEPTCPTDLNVNSCTNPDYNFNSSNTTGLISYTEGNAILFTNIGYPGVFLNNNQCYLCPTTETAGSAYSARLTNTSSTGNDLNATSCFISCDIKSNVITGTNTSSFTNDGTYILSAYVFSGYAGFYTEPSGEGGEYQCLYDVDCSSGGYTAVDNGTANPYCQPNEYTITFDMAGGTGGTTSSPVTFDADLPVITLPTRTGYTFGGYFRGVASNMYYDASGNRLKVWDTDSDDTLKAIWTANTYTITLNPNGGVCENTCLTTITSTYDDCTSLPGTEPTRVGYHFSGYYDDPDEGEGNQFFDAEGAENSISCHITSDVTLYAHWHANQYTVTLDDDGGSGGQGSVIATYDSPMPTLTSLPTKIGFDFGGYAAATGGMGGMYYLGTGLSATIWNRITNTTLYSYWIVNTFVCAAGTYLPMNSTVCTICPIGDYCTGGTYTFSTTSTQGISACSDLNDGSYTLSPEGSDDENDCYKACASYSLTNGTAIPVNASVNYSNTCQYTCMTNTNNPGTVNGSVCQETSCSGNFEMVSGVCTLCNRAHALSYKSTGNCIIDACETGWHANGQQCEANVIDCDAPNAESANKTWNNSLKAYGICTIQSCIDGFHVSSNACVSDEQACVVDHGTGLKEWDHSKNNWGDCSVNYCEPGYTFDPADTNEDSKPCGECTNKYSVLGEVAVKNYSESCQISSCLYQGELYNLENNECIPICDINGYSDETGTMKWNPSSKKCDRTCGDGYKPW